MTHLHITTWVVALILLFVSYSLYSSGSAKGAKITHMILRLFYILIILTGAELFVRFANWNGEYAGKMILGIITIGLMEMLLIRKKKEKSTGGKDIEGEKTEMEVSGFELIFWNDTKS